MTEFPRFFGPYEIVAEIARGASGAVFRARPRDGGPDVALKSLREETPDAAACARFRREAQMAARLRHPNLVPVLDAGEEGGRFFYTMPLVEGRPLDPALDAPRAAILIESGLSFLGFGPPPPNPSWGTLLSAGRSNYALWWLIVFPGTAIFLAVLSYNLIGEGLQEATDPRLRDAG